jgi:tetratricopeptide (TPR) repeat protein
MLSWRRHPCLWATLCLALASSAGAARSDEWVEVKSPNFVVLSDAGVRTAKSVAREFERIRAVFEAALPGMRLSPEPVTIYAVNNGASLERLLPEYGGPSEARPPGLFRPGFGRNDILLRTDSRGEHRYSLLYHEYFHLLTRLNLPGIPVWLDEGLAEFWAHTIVRGDRAELGLPSEARLAPLRREPPIPLATLLTAGYDSPYYREPDKRALFYAQSWALTHYFMLDGRGAHRRDLAAYLDALRRGAAPASAAERAFGDLVELERRLGTYVSRDRYLGMEMPAPPSVDESAFEIAELSVAEAEAVQADFLVWGPSYGKARPLALRAAALAPELPMPKEVLGALELRSRARPRAWKWFAEAARSPRASYLAHFYAATLAPPDAHVDVERSLLRSVEARPSFSPAYVELAYFYAGLGALDRSVAMAREAARRAPDSPWYRSLAARVLLRAGRETEALATMRAAVGLALGSGRAEDAGDLCRYGSLAGMPQEVLPACDRAVALRPAYGPFRDSRALARALAGDREGAVADFRAYLAEDGGEGPPEGAAKRRAWIRRIERGEPPLGESDRLELLGRPF